MAAEADWYNASAGTPWTTKGGDFASEKLHELTVKRNNYGWVRFNVLKTVKDFIANPDKNFGFFVRNSAFSQEIDIATTKFETNPEWRPKLVVEYSPLTADFTQKRIVSNRMRRPVSITTVNREMQIVNNRFTPVHLSLCRLDGATVASEFLAGGVRKTLSVRSAGVYLLTVTGDNFTKIEKTSLIR